MKLSPSVQKCLLLVGAGIVHQNNSWSATGTYFYTESRWLSRTGKVPTITVTCRSLIKKGLIEQHPDDKGMTKLTPAGQRIFDEIATPEFLELRADEIQYHEALKKYNAERERYRQWLDANHDVMQGLRERINQRAYEMNALKAKVTEIGFKIGSGANNVDELIDELRVTVRAYEDLKAEQDKEAATEPVYDRPIPF